MLKVLVVSALISTVCGAHADSHTNFDEASNDQNWYSGRTKHGGIAGTQSEKFSDVAFSISFIKDDDCSATGGYSSSATENTPKSGTNPVDLQLRVDRDTEWTVAEGQAIIVNELSLSGTRALSSMYFWSHPDFVKEVMQGRKLRVKFAGMELTDRFDLSGSAAAIAKAYRFCMNGAGDSDYFSERDPDSEFFNETPRLRSGTAL